MKRLLFTLSILLALALPLAAEAPLSLEEARAYVEAFPEAAAEDVVALDALERAVPEVTMPLPVFIFTDREVGQSWSGPMRISVDGRLEYPITLPTSRAPRPPPRLGPFLVVGAGGILMGILAASAWR